MNLAHYVLIAFLVVVFLVLAIWSWKNIHGDNS